MIKKYQLVAGERRLKASKLAGFDKIPAVVKQVKDHELLEIALIENIQRDDLNPVDESMAYRDLLEEHGFTQENLAKRIGKNRSTIANFIRLLQLPETIQDDLSNYRITTGTCQGDIGPGGCGKNRLNCVIKLLKKKFRLERQKHLFI